MTKERLSDIEYGPSHPEGMTDEQDTLAHLLFATPIRSSVPKRQVGERGYEYYDSEIDTFPIAFAETEDEFFIFKHNIDKPELPLSPMKVMLRNLPDAVLAQVGTVMGQLPLPEDIDYCVGIPKAGSPLAEAYEKATGMQRHDMLRKVETKGNKQVIFDSIFAEEQKQKRAQRILLIDDVATEGITKEEAIVAVRGNGYEIAGLVVLVDREQGARDFLASLNCNFYSVFTLRQLLCFGERNEYITDEQHKRVLAYLESESQRKKHTQE